MNIHTDARRNMQKLKNKFKVSIGDLVDQQEYINRCIKEAEDTHQIRLLHKLPITMAMRKHVEQLYRIKRTQDYTMKAMVKNPRSFDA